MSKEKILRMTYEDKVKNGVREVGVYFCSPTNSTFFTDCCDCAVTDSENSCPRCGNLVYGHESGESERRRLRWRRASRK